MNPVDPLGKARALEAPWVPKVVGELNGQFVKVVRVEGAYVWHHHEAEDELFFVLEGEIDIELRDRTLSVPAGSFCIVPRGVEHRPVAASPALVMLFEPATTRNTGNVDHPYTIEAEDLERL